MSAQSSTKAQMFLGGVLRAEQLHRVVRGSTDDRHQDHISAGRRCAVDEVRVAVPIDRRGRDATRLGKAVHRGHHGRGPPGCRLDARAIADVANDDLSRERVQVTRTGRVPREHAHADTGRGEPRHDARAESSGAARNQDHGRTTCVRTASSTVPRLSSTGSR